MNKHDFLMRLKTEIRICPEGVRAFLDFEGTIYQYFQEHGRGEGAITHCANSNFFMQEILPKLVNLQVLYLEETQITDILPLAGLANLRKISLHKTKITDISPLAGLVNLEYLDLSETQITDISPLAGLVNLKIYQ